MQFSSSHSSPMTGSPAAPLDRRQFLAMGSVAAAALWVGIETEAQTVSTQSPAPVRYCLNTSTLRGQELTVPQQIDVAAEAGYDGIELWIRDVEQYVQQGGSLDDLRKRLEDSRLKVESAIGFANWIVDDDAARAAGLEVAKRDMELVRRIGGTRIAAPPAGATNQTDLNLFQAAERYRRLLELGREQGVTPQLELWGFSKSISRLGELLFVAAESGHPDACLLPDVYHIYKGGSDFVGLQLLSGAVIHCFHMNDYPAMPPRESITDADRVYPGDGVAPLNDILQTLMRIGFRGALSLELFNREYWKQDARLVARTGLEKMRQAVARAQQSARS